ncbi:MAG: ABC transporter permease subunit, partial [Acidobacteriaceae bacterium]|nr:ABC transporter permease subunit [Acidobacteriaceae bacterium]
MLTNLRLAQIYAVLRLEVRKTLLARRGIWVYLLAFSPVLLYGGHTILMIRNGRPCDFGVDTRIFATVFQVFYLRLAIFFGCLGIFMNLIRGEVLDKSMHFYFLAPVRREVVLAGKFLAGLCVAIATYCSSIVVQFFALYAQFDWQTVQEYLSPNQGLQHLGAYVGVTLLACIGYGSVFLAAGILLRNPLVPAAVMLVWEAANPF